MVQFLINNLKRGFVSFLLFGELFGANDVSKLLVNAKPQLEERDALTASESCERLHNTLGFITTLASDPDYERLRTVNWAATAQLHPTCIVSPEDTQELTSIMKFLDSSGTYFAIRSGGHEVESGFANINNGILIDLARFNETTYEPEAGVVVVGTGTTWDKVYGTLEKINITVVGGRVPGVGVGGLILGSGLSYLSNKHGLACDNVLNYEVVLANGTLINAGEGSHPDLFWALKGGLNNFGIVTRFTLKAYSMGNVWGGLVQYSTEQAGAVINAFAEWEKLGENDTSSNLDLQLVLTNSSLGTLVTLFYEEPDEERAKQTFAPFFSIPSISDSTAVRNYSDFISLAVTDFTFHRWDWRTTTFRSNASFYQDMYTMVLSEVNTLPKVNSETVIYAFQPIRASLVEQGNLKGGNALGLQPTAQIWNTIDFGWLEEEDDSNAHATCRTLVDSIEAKAKQEGLYLEYQFLNDASGDQKVMQHYGAENFERLREVAARYDPKGVFQKQQPGGFKL